MRYALLLLCAVFAGCASPIAPQFTDAPCVTPTGPITLRVVMMGHATNRPLVGESAQLRAAGCVPRPSVTNSNGAAEWQIPAGVYTIELRHTAYFVDASVMANTQWLVSLPE